MAHNGGKPRLGRAAVALALTATLVVGGAEPSWGHAPFGDAIISNGTVQLGIHQQGHLNVPGGSPSSGQGTTFVGLRYVPTNAESTAPGCLCEGWGAADADPGSLLAGHANEAVGGVVNITPVSFSSTASTAVSKVTIGGRLEVTHDYHPSPATPNLYEVVVSIKNIGAIPVGDLRYRRVMDWDVEPTAFSEFVTIQGGGANVLFTSDNGFASANPLTGPSSLSFTGTAVDNGPSDHGALFDFGFGALAVGQTRTFKTFYGAAGTEASAISALTAVGAEIYSLGQPNTPNGPTQGTPNTFMFAFAGVGGVPIGSACPATTPGSGDIVGTSGPDKIVGTAGNDRIFGLGGNDQITGLGGDDIIFGGGGDDKLFGGDGNDTLCGGNGIDYLAGGNGNDTLEGGPGNDDLSGDAGDDTLRGDDGNDRLSGGAGTNTLDGGNGNDLCTGPPATVVAC